MTAICILPHWQDYPLCTGAPANPDFFVILELGRGAGIIVQMAKIIFA
jgi:hypothetical protein